MADEFEWDLEKNEKNIARHKLSFEDATLAFDTNYLEYQNLRKDYGEARWIRLAQLNKAIVVIVYTCRNNKIRIISARKASYYERKIYQRKIEEPNKLEMAPEKKR